MLVLALIKKKKVLAFFGEMVYLILKNKGVLFLRREHLFLYIGSCCSKSTKRGW